MLKKVFLLCLLSQFCFSQKALEKIYSSSVNGIQLFNPDTNDETPFIQMGKGMFVLTFDILDKGYEKIYYTIKHFDRNWNEDQLFESEYIDGYTLPQIYDYQPSFNTRQNYTHYTLEFPNKDMQPKVSGNYLLTVYNENHKPLFSKRISFYEDFAHINVGYERYSTAKNSNITQRVIAQASVSGINSISTRQLSLCILQNNNWKNSICNIEPQFVNGNSFTFGQLSNAFEGGNEFYTFDTKNISVPGYGVSESQESNPLYLTYLYPIAPYPLDYAYNPDVNGAYYFRRFDLNQERDARREGDYTPVNFSVAFSKPLDDKDLYIVGLFNNYELSDSNKMIFDEIQGRYVKTIVLKQGYYNYTIATVDKKNGQLSLSEIPGSFWQTENLYQSLLYYTPFGGTYDALIGYGEIRANRL
ncbi:type IX secretion system plug protein domain-containing protein [uncultured Apibacter sp.]|uniref:type IX secretion system plug protein n=1 Tax=uncultured Apibacter sp. TaxID=1778616 RepID=UPI0025CD1FD4|nr:type IX secretion system plug protein domain-containing protein [uncultured Apibacter sp.]